MWLGLVMVINFQALVFSVEFYLGSPCWSLKDFIHEHEFELKCTCTTFWICFKTICCILSGWCPFFWVISSWKDLALDFVLKFANSTRLLIKCSRVRIFWRTSIDVSQGLFLFLKFYLFFLKLKEKLYRTAITPTMLYDSECWVFKMQHEHKMRVAKMMMFRLMWGHIRKDKMRNDHLRGQVGVESVEEKTVKKKKHFKMVCLCAKVIGGNNKEGWTNSL